MDIFLSWKCLFLLIIINIVNAERIKDMIYMSLDGAAACFRRHNGTHQFGCSSGRSGSVGVVYLIEDKDDLKWLEAHTDSGPYTVVMSFATFTRETLLRLRDTNNINGILLARNISHEYPSHYSAEDTCPNRPFSSCNDAMPWNPYGSGLLLEDWPFPMFYMENQTLLEAIKSCYWTHNAHNLEKQDEKSLCAIEMNAFMFATLNSELCIRRTEISLNLNPTEFCDPLGDRNIHWPLMPLNADSNSVIMVMARLDASSLFYDVSPGAGSTVAGLVTLLATAHYLHSLKISDEKTNVVFSLFNGESFDYIGSSRLVYDLKEGNFNALGGVNLKLTDIKYLIEISQLGKGNLFLHTTKGKNKIVEGLQKALHAKIMDTIPPTSVQSFLKKQPDLPAVVISNYGDNFTNNYYNSILDDADSIHFNRSNVNSLASSLAIVAVRLTEILYLNITRNNLTSSSKNVSEIENLISQMLSCYLISAKCDLFRAASAPGTKLIDHALSLYVGVHKVSNIITKLTGQLLAFLTSDELEMNESTCHENHLVWMGGYNYTGLCINSTVNYSIALSPAFSIDGYDMKSGLFSTWTESIWQILSIRMFLKPSAAIERFSMILGSLVTVISFIVVWFINSRADILFDSRRAVDC